MEETMPRTGRGPHLYLKASASGAEHWYIRDGARRLATGCDKGNPQGAREALERHLGQTLRPRAGAGDPDHVLVSAVIDLYGRDIAPNQARPHESAQRLARLEEFFGGMPAGEVTPSTCAAYVRWRTKEGQRLPTDPPERDRAVKPQSTRRELADLQAAFTHAWKSKLLKVQIPVALPAPGAARERWLTRSEAARLVASCLGWSFTGWCDLKTRREHWARTGRQRDRINPHVARFVLIGLRSGTRHDAILALGWHQHLHGGWIDVKRGILYRRAAGEQETTKRKPPAPMPDKLWAHTRRWKEADKGRLYVVSWEGDRVQKMRRAFNNARDHAGLGLDVTPHTLRHTCATWLVEAGRPLWEVAGYLGMTVEMVEKVYGHHNEEHLRGAARALR